MFLISNEPSLAVTISGALVEGLASLSHSVAKSIGGFGKQFAPSGSGPSNPTLLALKTTGKTAVASFVNVWDALEIAGRTMGSEAKETTVSVVEHKWGNEAGEITRKGMQITGDVVETIYNVDQVGKMSVKKIVKKTAKKSGKEFVKGMVSDDEKKKPLSNS